MSKLYTTDETDGYATQDADICDYDNHENAKFWLSDKYHGFQITGFKEVDFPDCWLKCREKPALYLNGGQNRIHFLKSGNVMAYNIECYVLHPGQHPGGDVYWLTPIEPVYAPILVEDNE